MELLEKLCVLDLSGTLGPRFSPKRQRDIKASSSQAAPACQVTKAVVGTSAFLDLLHKANGRFRATQTKAAGAAFAATVVLQQEVPQLLCQRTRWEPRMICRVPVVHLVSQCNYCPQ